MSDTTTTTDPVADAVYPVYRRFRKWVQWGTLINTAAGYDSRAEMARAAERTARHAKARKVGYRVGDEVFYPRPVIEMLLPYALQANAIPPPTVADEAEINRKHAGKEGYGGWECAVADIRAGLKQLSDRQRAMLVMRFVEGCSVPWLARKLGKPETAVYSSLSRAVRRIQNTLGGRKP